MSQRTRSRPRGVRGFRVLLLRTAAAVLVAAAILVELPSAQAGASGVLDPSFGRGGIVLTPFGGNLDAAVAGLGLQPDGKIVAGGGVGDRITLARYRPDGSLDRAFGSRGIATTTLADNARVGAITLQPDGRIVVAGGTGTGEEGFLVARYTPGGVLDRSFGTNGFVRTPIDGVAFAHAIARQHDGKIVVAGISYVKSHQAFALARYNAAGSLDRSFGSGGVVTTLIDDWDDARGVAIQPDGKIVVAGAASGCCVDDNSLWDFALARYRPDGSLDPGFGDGGVVTTPIGTYTRDWAKAVVLQPDGKLIVVGDTTNERTQGGFALAGYLPNGSLDSGFGSGGRVIHLGPYGGSLEAVALQPDGKVVAAGASAGRGFAVVRLLPNGTFDETFGVEGIVSLRLAKEPGSPDEALAVAVQKNGGIVAAGQSYQKQTDEAHSVFALVRLLGDRSHRLRVRLRGGRKGTVVSKPAAISCGKTCSAWFGAGTSVKLITKPPRGWIVTWSRACSGERRSCRLRMGANRTAVATFSRCVVPRAVGKPLTRAKRAIRRAHCSLGHVKRRSSRKRAGLVLGQRPRPGAKRPAGTPIDLVVSRGR